MKKALLLGSFLALGASASFGAAIDLGTSCTGGNVASATIGSLNADGYICGDKLFNAFTGTGLTGTLTFKQLNAPDQYALTITPTGGSISTAFSFGFTVSVNPSTFPYMITQITTSMDTANVNGGNPQPNGSTGTVSLSVGSGFTLFGLNVAAEGGQSNMLTKSDIYSFAFNPGGAPQNGANGKFQDATIDIGQSAVPEPVSLSLTGLGLLGLGFFGRRRLKS